MTKGAKPLEILVALRLWQASADLVFRFEFVFARAADGADPVIG